MSEGLGETIACACGCEGTLTKYDERKRPRQFLPGHQMRAALAALRSAPVR